MKQYLFLATAIATASLFTGCSNNEYVGDQPEAFNGTDGAIAFSMGKANTTRATELTSDDAASKLGSVFYVYGTKGDTHTDVFKNYKVTYEKTNKDQTSDNLKGWEYVGKSLTVDNPTPNIGTGENDKQTIKYWDYSASKYQFYAFSADKTDLSSKKIKVNKETSGENAYTVDIKAGADIGKLYFADYVEISKGTPNNPVQQNAENTYGGYVKFTFRNLAAKVRVGFYETVPGYKIQIKNMYAGANASPTVKTDKFLADCPNTEASQDSKITVTYITDAGATQNRAFVSEKNNADNTTRSLSEKSELTLGGGVFTDPLSTTSSSPTWDNGGNYTFFWPQETNNTPLKITVDYTLTSNDGSGETIEVKGATATVPADYVKWAANTAYTYIFKISDNTNGTTGTPGTDPAGLYPITFDAAVVDMTENTYLTTVSTPSVTVSQNGTNFVDPGAGFVFTKDEDIILKVMLNGTEPETKKCTIHAQFVATYNYNNTAEQNVNNTWGSALTEYKLTKRTTQTPDNGYWVLKVDCNYTEGENQEEKTATTYVIIRVGNAEQEPANP